MLTSIILDMIANISILSTASYIFIKLIPKKKKITLNTKEQVLMIGIAGLTGFLLMLFSIALPNKALLDLRHIILILMIYYFGNKFALPVVILMSALRFLLGVNPASIQTAIMYILFALFLPIICKKVIKKVNNKYSVLLILNAICVSLIALNLQLLYQNLVSNSLIYIGLLILSSFVIIMVTAFIEDLLTSRILYLEVQEHARMDFLTGLYNMREFNEKWKNIQLDKKINTTALMMIDIDHFKWINDNYGHSNGNFVLRQVATILKVKALDSELVYRVGGEEFCLILNDLPFSDQQKAAEKIRMSIANTSFLLENGDSIQVTASIGLAASTRNKDMKKLFRLADRCLYLAKDQGRNKVICKKLENE